MDSKEYEKFLDEKLKEVKETLLNSYEVGEVKEILIINPEKFINGDFRVTNKGLLKIPLGFKHNQVCYSSGLPVKKEDWRIQPLLFFVWRGELREDEK